MDSMPGDGGLRRTGSEAGAPGHAPAGASAGAATPGATPLDETLPATPGHGVAVDFFATRTSGDLGSSSTTSGSTITDFDHGRFVPGTVLADRYRIIELLGKGGMGEVYRADDLRLGQTVALKFLIHAQAGNVLALQSLYNEVRTARQVSHPNVARVYDVGEVDGLAFISMEYIDGENLTSLLKRIGRLPLDKGAELALQLCAGLSAIHDQGLLHRDLKPSNLMIDGRGRLRITDFSLAAVAQQLAGSGARAGTPAYMAPEQLAANQVSIRSDLYSLGLVLFELFTGKRVFEGASWTELAHRHEEHVPPSPAEFVPELDPGIESIILRCLEKLPERRPPSARAVSAALPGGDPLAAALAAGETPSPELVCETHSADGVRPLVGGVCLAVTLVGLVLLALANDAITLARYVPLLRRPEVLADHAQRIVVELGYPTPGKDSAYGFTVNQALLAHISENDFSAARWERLRDSAVPPVTFWYRQSPRRLDPRNVRARVEPDDPPPLTPGMVQVGLDTRGRLTSFLAIPQGADSRAAGGPAGATAGGADDPPPDWEAMLRHTELPWASLSPAAPRLVPPVFSDARAAWTISGDARTPERRVEAAAYQGRLTHLRILPAWMSVEDRAAPGPSQAQRPLLGAVILTLLSVMVVGGGILTYRNLRLGRGDRRGAFRIAIYLFVCGVVSWLVTAHQPHQPMAFLEGFIRALGPIFFSIGFIWLLYLAIEPSVRRRWPRRLVSWSRLLNGRFRDPLVGQDVLIGTAFGVLLALVFQAEHLLPRWLGMPAGPPPIPAVPWGSFEALSTLGLLISAQTTAVFNGFIFMFMPLLVFVLVRREWPAAGLTFCVWLLYGALRGWGVPSAIVVVLATSVLWTLLPLRFGLLCTVVHFFVFLILQYLPATLNLSAWYALSVNTSAALAALLALVAFHVSFGGRPLIRRGWLEA